MADYWGLDIGSPYATNLVVGCMFDRPNVEDQILNFTSPFTLANNGSPGRPTIDGKLAYQPATLDDVRDTWLNYFPWVDSDFVPQSLMMNFRTEVATPFTDEAGLHQVGFSNGGRGWYIYVSPTGRLTAASNWNSNLVQPPSDVVLNQQYRIVCRAGVLVATNQHDMFVDGTRYGPMNTGSVAADQQCQCGSIMNGQFGMSFPGSITDYFVWDRLLTDQEVTDLFADPYRFLIPPDTGVVATQNAILMGENF